MRTSESHIRETGLSEIAWLAANRPGQEFHGLIHHIGVDQLRRCFNRMDGKKAVGVDKVSKEMYGKDLTGNLENLIDRMKRKKYHPGPVRQVLIPKEGKKGATRPLGISNFEDKLVQKRVQEILEAVYEPVFLDCSYGYRPGRSNHEAVKGALNHLYREEVETVIDVDLANFFNTIDHEMLVGYLKAKIKDRKFLQLITRLLKAGVMGEGLLLESEEGVTQGSSCSSVLANIFAHYVIDEWIEETVKPLMRGQIRMFRYADDMIVCCRHKEDAERIMRVLEKRLNKYKLELNKEKTKMVNFSKREAAKGNKQETFEFLGFRFYLEKSRSGRAVVAKVKTSGKRFRSKLRKLKDWIKGVKDKEQIGEIWKTLRAKLRGHVQYYGVSFNMGKVASFIHRAKRIIFKWLNRRSQRKSFTWEKFELYIRSHPLPKAEVKHRFF